MNLTKNRSRSTQYFQRLRKRKIGMETLENRSLLAGFNFADFSNIAGLNLEGVSAITSDNRLRLTPAIGGQVGAAWYSAEKEFVTGNFSTTFRFQPTPTAPSVTDPFAARQPWVPRPGFRE